MLKYFLYSIYFILLFYLVWFMPIEHKSDIDINLLPGQTIQLYISALINGFAPLHIVFGNLIGNIVLTIPIGMLFYQSFRYLGKWMVLFLSLYIPCYIEMIQLLLHIIGYGTRSIDIDDVLLNMLGIWLGYIGAAIMQKKY